MMFWLDFWVCIYIYVYTSIYIFQVDVGGGGDKDL